MLRRLTTFFPLWAVLGSMLAYLLPEPFAALRPSITYLLGVVMFGMGITLTAANFAEVLKRPGAVALGVGLQYLLMPLLAWLLALAFALPLPLLAGMVLVGASPGGTASNVICYLARGDVALSITLTTVSTLLAAVATPLLALLYVGQQIDVPVGKMLVDILKIVILPVIAGVLINRYFGEQLRPLKRIFPLLSIAAIVLIIAIIVALNHEQLAEVGIAIALAVLLHNALGLSGGYALARLLGQDTRSARTLAIEVGMQNSGLAVALASKYFSPAAALPGALFSIWHNVSGSTLAAWWSRRES